MVLSTLDSKKRLEPSDKAAIAEKVNTIVGYYENPDDDSIPLRGPVLKEAMVELKAALRELGVDVEVEDVDAYVRRKRQESGELYPTTVIESDNQCKRLVYTEDCAVPHPVSNVLNHGRHILNMQSIGSDTWADEDRSRKEVSAEMGVIQNIVCQRYGFKGRLSLLTHYTSGADDGRLI